MARRSSLYPSRTSMWHPKAGTPLRALQIGVRRAGCSKATLSQEGRDLIGLCLYFLSGRYFQKISSQQVPPESTPESTPDARAGTFQWHLLWSTGLFLSVPPRSIHVTECPGKNVRVDQTERQLHTATLTSLKRSPRLSETLTQTNRRFPSVRAEKRSWAGWC